MTEDAGRSVNHAEDPSAELRAGVCAVIPAYNPGPGLVPVVRGAARQLGSPGQVLVVNDGSTDGSVESVRGLGVRVLEHERNQGKGVALRTGFAAALDIGADWVFTLDADGQHDPEEMSRFLAEAVTGRSDLLIGNRMADTGNMPWIRIFTNRFTSWVISLLAGQRIKDSQSGYRLISAPVLKAIELRFDRFDSESEILVKAAGAGFRIGEVPIRTIYGEERSTIRPFRDTLRFIALVARLSLIVIRSRASRVEAS